MSVAIPVSIGELVDKYTILLIKRDKILDTQKLHHVSLEINLLQPMIDKLCINELDVLELKRCNETLWKIEDDIREKETLKQFDHEFIKLARSVYITNDSRSELKKEINIKYNSIIHEVKSYKQY
jgi:hypothetical protein